MKKTIVSLLLCSLLTPTLWANDPSLMRGANNYWLCAAYDGHDKQWQAKSPYQRTAINQAWDACKKQSAIPDTCKAAKEFCEAIIKGVSNKPMWKCTAFDQMAKSWVSDVYRQRNDAALGAKAYCQERSGVPHSCYVNLMTCTNLNARN